MLRLLVPLLLLRLLWRSRGNAGYRAQIWHRIGLYGRHRPALARERVWVHAVSVGETLAIIPLIERLLAERPEARVLITSTTPTGAEQVRQKLGDRVDWDWVPFDTPGAVRRFFAHWHPTIGVLVETEIWPNLVTHAAARGVPMVLLNARLSKRSARGYARVAGLTRPTLACLSGVAAQGRADARRLRTLGVNPDVLTVTGNLKFAIDTDALHRANEREWSALGPGLADRPVWLAASTHPGEEEQVLKAFSVLKTERPEAFLMLAPRHPDRVANVLALPEMDQFRWFYTAPSQRRKPRLKRQRRAPSVRQCAIGMTCWWSTRLATWVRSRAVLTWYSLVEVSSLTGAIIPWRLRRGACLF